MAHLEQTIVNDITNLNNQKRLNNLEHLKFCDECIIEICTVRTHLKTFYMHLKTTHMLLIIDGEQSQNIRHIKVRKLLIRYNGIYFARQLPHSGLDLLYKPTSTSNTNTTRTTPRMLSDRQDFYFHHHPFYLKQLIRLNVPDIEHPIEHSRHIILDTLKW